MPELMKFHTSRTKKSKKMTAAAPGMNSAQRREIRFDGVREDVAGGAVRSVRSELRHSGGVHDGDIGREVGAQAHGVTCRGGEILQHGG